MATLDREEIKKRKRKKIYGVFILAGIIIIFAPWIAEVADKVLYGLFMEFGKFEFNFNYWECLQLLLKNEIRMVLIGTILLLLECVFVLSLNTVSPNIGKAKTVQVTKNNRIPAPAGHGEFGSDWFMGEEEKRKVFAECEFSPTKGFSKLSEKAGLIIDYIKIGTKEIIKYVAMEVHVLVRGITGKGKTRRLLLPSTWMNIWAGVNICVTDIKGDIYANTSTFAKKKGYREIVYDLRNPEKGMHYNYLMDIVGLLKSGNLSEATDRTWDLVSTLVGEAKGEKLWNNGECAAIAAAILIVAQDAPDECKNLTNVYYFLNYMCKMDEDGIMPISRYLKQLPESHSARGAFGTAEIAPSRTRSSFFTSALATLRLFTGYNIAEMSSCSDYSFDDIDEQKTIIYIIVPDEKQTRYELCTLYIDQLYIKLLDIAKRKGGSLDRKFIFRWDEFGNCPAVSNMGGKMSAARSRNIFFELYIQDDQQLEARYKDEAKNIKANAAVKVFLGGDDNDMLQHLSKSCGEYTIETGSASTSASDGKQANVSYSSNANLTGRPVLFPKEIEKIEPPEALVFVTGKDVAVTNIPDISNWYANKELGLGNEEFNRNLYKEIHEAREARNISAPKLWGIWNQYQLVEESEKIKDEKVSFL